MKHEINKNFYDKRLKVLGKTWVWQLDPHTACGMKKGDCTSFENIQETLNSQKTSHQESVLEESENHSKDKHKIVSINYQSYKHISS